MSRRVAYVVSRDLVKAASLLPSNPGRSALVHTLASVFGLFRANNLRLIQPTPATPNDLTVYHDRDYIDFILSREDASIECTEKDAEYGLEDDCPVFMGLAKYIQLVAGASLTAAHALKTDQADVAICWDGGRHHARRSRASGFCYVADCILSILSLKKPAGSLRPKVMYLDLDLHFSDAVSEAFSSTSSLATVLTLSVHHAAPGFFPISPLSALTRPNPTNPYQLAIPLCRGASNDTFCRTWNIVDGVKNAFNPDYVIVQCGVDGLAGDPCAIFNWSLDVEQPGTLGHCLQKLIDWDCKTLLLGGGGYNSPNAARAWAYLTSIACGSPLPVDVDIPHHNALPQYEPSFTLDVPKGNMQDENTPQYLDEIEEAFASVIKTISEA